MKTLLMALAFLGFSTFAVACPCSEKMANCPKCGKVMESPYKDKKILEKEKSRCEKCAKRKDSKDLKKD